MSLSLAIKEGLSGFRRAKLSTAVSVLTISISLILLGMFAIVTKNAASLVESIRNKVEIEAFLTEPFKSSDADSLRAKMLNLPGVEKVTFISKEDAARSSSRSSERTSTRSSTSTRCPHHSRLR